MPLTAGGDLPAAVLLLYAAFSLAMGSFLNVVIYRLPLVLMRRWRLAAAEVLDPAAPLNAGKAGEVESDARTVNLAIPRSHCPHCHTPIALQHLIPVFSWLWLKGRCATCSAPISPRYPLVELLAAGAGVCCLLALYPDYVAVVALSCFCWALIVLALIDLETGYLPDEITLGMVWAGLLYNLYSGAVPLPDAVLGAALGYGSLWLLATAFRLLRGMDGMGGGDIKMLAMIGAWFGWLVLPSAVLLGCVATLLYALGLLLAGRSVRVLRFGPGLALAGIYAFWAHLYPFATLGELIISLFPTL